MLKTSLIMAVVNLVGNCTLIPAFGAEGAAWASFLSMTVFAAACFYFYSKQVKCSKGSEETKQKHIQGPATERLVSRLQE